MCMSYPTGLYEIRYGDEKFLVSSSVVVVVDTQHGERAEVQSIDVQRVH